MVLLLGRNVEKRDQKAVVCIILAFGVGITITDPWSYRYDMLNKKGRMNHSKSALMVDFVLILSNISAAIYFTMNKFLMKNRIIKHILITNLMMMAFFVVMAVLYDGAQFNLNRKKGLFGFLAADSVFFCLFFYGFVGTLFGSIGYLICINFFPPLVLMNAILAEPIIA